MNYLETLIHNGIYLLFPIAIYLLYITYQKNINQKENKLYLELAMFSSLYLILRRGIAIDDYLPLILFNVPLLMCYLKRSTVSAFLMSVILIWYSTFVLKYPFLFVLVEYGLYFIIYSYFQKKKPTLESILSIFILIKTFFLSFETFLWIRPNNPFFSNVFYLICLSTILYGVCYLILYFLKKGEEIVDLHSILYQLEQEKKLRSSLFKVTHEIKNPIAVCKGYLDMMDVKDEKKMRKYIPIIQEEIARTLTLMDDFLACNKMKIEKEEVDMYLLIEEVAEALKPLLKQNQIILDYELPEEEFYLDIDYNRIKQVLVNLIKNAMEAKQKETMKIKIRTHILKNQFEIQIQDDGIGMNKETLSKMEEMFYTTKEKGSGLGVSLSKEIMKLHGGKIRYESKEKKGTTAFLTFPIGK